MNTDETPGRNFNLNVGNFDNFTVLLRENERLQEENNFLKRYLVCTKNNATLKTASILTSILSWVDASLFKRFEDLIGQEINVENTQVQRNQGQSSCRSPRLVQGVTTEYQNTVVNNSVGPKSDAIRSNIYSENLPAEQSIFQHYSSRPQEQSQNTTPGITQLSQNLQTPQQVPSIRVETKDSFRPISPAIPFIQTTGTSQLRPEQYIQQQNQSRGTSPIATIQQFDGSKYTSQLRPRSQAENSLNSIQGYSQQMPKHIPQPAQNIRPKSPLPFIENQQDEQGLSYATDSTMAIKKRQTSQPTKTRENQSFTTQNITPHVPFSDMFPEEDPSDWNNLVYQPPEVIGNAYMPKSDQASFETKAGSEGYGTQVEAEPPNYSMQSDGRNRLGDPLAASTPRKGGVSYAHDNTFQEILTPQKTTMRPNSPTPVVSVLHRPIDAVIGLNPVFTDARRQKLSKIKPSKRMIGEIAFQLDRRILDFVFAVKSDQETTQNRRRRFYGYNISNVGAMIRRDATDNSGKFNAKRELEMRYRFDFIIKTLVKFGYKLEKHSVLSQDLVNKYGLLSGPPDQKTAQFVGLDDPVILRVLLSHLIRDETLLQEVLILLDCLCLLSHDDKKPIFSY